MPPQHCAGIPDYKDGELLAWTLQNPTEDFLPIQFLTNVSHQPFEYQPGSGVSYSSTNYVRVFTMDSAVLALASSGCGWCTVRVFDRRFTLEDAVGSHTFAPLEARASVCLTAFLSGVHSAYRLPL
jgi:hypothetical protein